MIRWLRSLFSRRLRRALPSPAGRGWTSRYYAGHYEHDPLWPPLPEKEADAARAAHEKAVWSEIRPLGHPSQETYKVAQQAAAQVAELEAEIARLKEQDAHRDTTITKIHKICTDAGIPLFPRPGACAPEDRVEALFAARDEALLRMDDLRKEATRAHQALTEHKVVGGYHVHDRIVKHFEALAEKRRRARRVARKSRSR